MSTATRFQQSSGRHPALLGIIYFMVRGLDNLETGREEEKKALDARREEARAQLDVCRAKEADVYAHRR